MYYQTSIPEDLEVKKGDLVYRHNWLLNSYYRVEQILDEEDIKKAVLLHLPKLMFLCLLGETSITVVTEPFSEDKIKDLVSLEGIVIPTIGREPMLIRFAKKVGYSRGDEFDRKKIQQLEEIQEMEGW